MRTTHGKADEISWLTAVLAAVGDMLLMRVGDALNPAAAHTSLSIAVGVATLAALSTMLGHAVIFLVNRVQGGRLVAGMALGALYLVFLHLLTGVTIGFVAIVVMDRAELTTLVVAYLLTLAPRVLGFLVFIPHVGLWIGKALEGWCLIALMVMLAHVLHIPYWQAMALAGSAWVLTHVTSRLLSRPVAALASRAWTRLTGRPTIVTAHDILAGGPFVPLDRSTAELLR